MPSSEADPTRCQLIGRDNGAGLSRDMALLADALRHNGSEVTLSALAHRGRLAEWLTRRRLAGSVPAFDVNLMLERIRPEFAAAAHRNVLVPNPEYFRPQDRATLAQMRTLAAERGGDAVWLRQVFAKRGSLNDMMRLAGQRWMGTGAAA